jgi:hypothetical protein
MATASAGYVLLDQFLPEILQYCNGAPSIMVRSHTLKATIDLCNKSLVLKKDASAFEPEEGVHTYTLKFSGNRYRAIAVGEVKIGENTQPLQRITEEELDHSVVNWRTREATTPTKYFLTDELNTIRLWPTPKADIDSDCNVNCHVTYKRDQTEIDEFLYEKWEEVIQAGVISRMLLIGEASWFNPRLAVTFARSWSRGVREARKTTLSGTGKFPGRVQPQNYVTQGSGTNSTRGGISWV